MERLLFSGNKSFLVVEHQLNSSHKKMLNSRMNNTVTLKIQYVRGNTFSRANTNGEFAAKITLQNPFPHRGNHLFTGPLLF